VTKWGPTVITDKPPQGRFSGLRSKGFRSEMTRSAAGQNFRKALVVRQRLVHRHVVVGEVREPLPPPVFECVVCQVQARVLLVAVAHQVDVPRGGGIDRQYRFFLAQDAAPRADVQRSIAQVIRGAEEHSQFGEAVNHFLQLRRRRLVVDRVRIGKINARVDQLLAIGAHRRRFEIEDLRQNCSVTSVEIASDSQDVILPPAACSACRFKALIPLFLIAVSIVVVGIH
jgi:hypothetical protein